MVVVPNTRFSFEYWNSPLRLFASRSHVTAGHKDRTEGMSASTCLEKECREKPNKYGRSNCVCH